MKTMFIVAMVVFLGVSTAYSAGVLVKGEKFGQIGLGDQTITVYRVIDGQTTCYVTQQGKWGSHAISCVK